MLAKSRNKETGQVDELIITIRSDLGTPALFNFNPDREIQSVVDSDRSGFSISGQGVFKVWPVPRAPIEELKIRYVSLIAYEVFIHTAVPRSPGSPGAVSHNPIHQ